MKTQFKIWLLVIFIITYSMTCPTLQSHNHDRDYEKEVSNIINTVNHNLHTGIAVASIDGPAKNLPIYYEKNAQQLFVPASNMKILTALAALHYLKPDFKFRTIIYTDGDITDRTDKVLEGNLYLKGDGDPSLSVDHLEQLVLELKKRNITTIHGDICIDNTCFDSMQFGPGCAWDDGACSWNAPIDGLNINNNCVTITVSPGTYSGTQHIGSQHLPTVYSVSPLYSEPFVKIYNRSETIQTKNQPTIAITRRWQNHENSIDITGTLPNTIPFFEETVSIENPALFAGHLFTKILTKHAITFTGNVKIRKTPEHALVLTHHYSKPLYTLINHMLSTSDNLYADALFKKLGSVYTSAPGSFSRGTEAIKKFLVHELNFAQHECVVVDGSGLSRYNLLSPQQILKLLVWAAQSPYASYFTKALAVSGKSGTLLKRLSKLSGAVHAKTGTLGGVSSLSGYLHRPDKTVVAFSFLLNGFVQPTNKTVVSLGLVTHEHDSNKIIDYKAQVEDELCYYFAVC